MSYIVSCPAKSHPIRRPDDKRRGPDGRGPRRPRTNRALPLGVYLTPQGRFVAKVRVAGRLWYCGTWGTEAEAAEAVIGAYLAITNH